ncbi:MAG: DNA internalization-related competence protein ComEC/Rec2, partial [Thermodesulfobacteriota bacterium]
MRRRYFFFILNQTSSSNPGKIMASLITGKKEIISLEIRDLFSKAGISHLLAISGLHLSIVSLLFFSIFYRLFSFVPALLISGKSKKIAGILSIVPLILYGVFTGFSPSCQRALIMIIVLIFSLIREKEKDIISSLSFAGILILIMDPAALFSISFQLSFSAVVFIIYGASLLKHYSLMLHNNIWSKLGLMVFITLFAGLGTSPLTAHYFNVVSTIGLVSNLIAIPVLGFIVLPLGLVCLVLFSWLPAFAGFIIQVCSQLILFLMKFAQLLVYLPFSWSRAITLQWLEIVAIYIGFSALFLILKGYKKSSIAVLVLSFLLVISNFVNISSNKMSDNNLQVTMIDVGQGSSTLIQTPGGKNILVDGGGFSDISTFDTGRYIIAPFLWKKRIKTIDYVILTHPESDHLNGLLFILDNFSVKTLIKNSDSRDAITYDTMMKICKKHNIKIYNPLEHDKNFDINSVKLRFFDSSKEIFLYNLNNNSLVFKLVYNNFSMLFPGDILKQREKNLSRLTGIDLHSDVILAPHHGSASSSTKVFLEKVSPASVIISCGWHNRYGFPDDKVLKRYNAMGINIFRTDENGAVFVSSDGNNYKINTF